MKKDKRTPLQKMTGDEGYVLHLPLDMYYLWCCDCKLRHAVYIEEVGKNKVRICLLRDDRATENYRSLQKL